MNLKSTGGASGSRSIVSSNEGGESFMIAMSNNVIIANDEIATRYRDMVFIRDPFSYGPLPNLPVGELLSQRVGFYLDLHKKQQLWYSPTKRARNQKLPSSSVWTSKGLDSLEAVIELVASDDQIVELLFHRDKLTDFIIASCFSAWFEEIKISRGIVVELKLLELHFFNPTGREFVLLPAERKELNRFWYSFVAGRSLDAVKALNSKSLKSWEGQDIARQYLMFIPPARQLIYVDETLLSRLSLQDWRTPGDILRRDFDFRILDLIGDLGFAKRLQEWSELENGRYVESQLIEPGTNLNLHRQFRLTDEGQRILEEGLREDDRLVLSPLMGMAY